MVSAPVLVQKFGGTSLATPARIRRAAQRIAASRTRGTAVVAVVSAMGESTDRLLSLAGRVAGEPADRELDQLLATGEGVSASLVSMALADLGVPAISLLGFQAGIRTDRRHARARIVNLAPSRVEKELAQGRTVVVAGFQGMGGEQDVTTLGRGGSDLTAVALAAGLRAGRCEIFTDVRGVYTADPRLAPRARLLRYISYAEMLELASAGARVVHPRAVELAQAYGVPLRVRSSFHQGEGTVIGPEQQMENRDRVRGIAHEERVARISVVGVPDHPGIAAAIFQPLAEADITTDVIVQTAGHEGRTDLSFTVASGEGKRAQAFLLPVARAMGARDVLEDNGLAKVAVVGSGIRGHPAVAATMFKALAGRGINIELISTSEIRITCVIRADRVAEAVRALAVAFDLSVPA